MADLGQREQFAQYNRYFTKLKDTYEKDPVVRDSLQLLLSLLLISFLTFFVLRPTIDSISERYAKVKLQQEVSQKLDAKIQALIQAKQVWDSQQDKLALLDESLPDKALPEKFLQQIEGLAAINNVNISGITEDNVLLFGKDLRPPEQKANDSTKQDLPSTKSTHFSLIISGEYANTKGFLDDLENLRSQNIIQSYTVSNNSGNNKGVITLKVTGIIPYLDTESLINK